MGEIRSRTRFGFPLVLRCFIASVGGYYYAFVLAILVAESGDASRAEATISGVLVAFLAHVIVIVAAFAVRSVVRLSLILSITLSIMALIVLWKGSLYV